MDIERARDSTRVHGGLVAMDSLEGTFFSVRRISDGSASPGDSSCSPRCRGRRSGDTHRRARRAGASAQNPDWRRDARYVSGRGHNRSIHSRMRGRGRTFKATAGLHHPLRAEYRLTYEDGSACSRCSDF